MLATSPERAPLLRKALAWAVHLYTALGSLIGFLALLAIFRGEVRAAFLWMLVAVLIDSTDGALARRVNVKSRLPGFDGRKLDDIVDYLNYVVVPVVLVYHWGLLPQRAGIWLAALPLLASAYGFCQADAKTPDLFFKGFPSYWNVVAFYFYAAAFPKWLNAVIITALAIFVFIPVRCVYPSRTPTLKILTCALCALWGGTLLVLIWQLPTPSRTLLAISWFFPVYYVGLSLYLQVRGRRRQWPSPRC